MAVSMAGLTVLMLVVKLDVWLAGVLVAVMADEKAVKMVCSEVVSMVEKLDVH